MTVDEKIAELVARLKAHIDGSTALDPNAFDSTLAELYELGDPDVVSALCAVFDDDFDDDAMLFSVVHTMEAFEDSVYVHQIAKGSPTLVKSARYWGGVILMRSLNSDETLAALTQAYPDLAPEEQASLSAIARDIISERPEFEEPWTIVTG